MELATTQAVLINMHPNDRLFPLIASVLQTSVAVGGPNTCNLAAGQILAQHPLAINYLEMASVPQIHLCFVLGLLFFLSVQPELRHNSHSHIHKIANHNLRIDNR